MISRLLLLPWLAVWLLAGVVAIVILALGWHVRRMREEQHLPFRTAKPRAAGLRGKGIRLR